ncbi:MAG: type II toxin-antitoxin system VapC family toxin [Treponema sp.]|jgi:predicted nucleic acid-binding protein|nr:type II toxin-antitoxin system VapC family toxin [Treponema sp.]
MLVYFDTSAFIKLVLEEEFSTDVRNYFDTLDLNDIPVSADLLKTEALRAVIRLELDRDTILLALEKIQLIPVERRDFDIAGIIEPRNRNLRSLDAIHLAVAKATDVDLFVTYDVRQIAAARSLGLTVMSPGNQAAL